MSPIPWRAFRELAAEQEPGITPFREWILVEAVKGDPYGPLMAKAVEASIAQVANGIGLAMFRTKSSGSRTSNSASGPAAR